MKQFVMKILGKIGKLQSVGYLQNFEWGSGLFEIR